MSTQAIGWAPSNRWFMPGFEKSFSVERDDVSIRLMPLPYSSLLRWKPSSTEASGFICQYVEQVLDDGEVVDYLKACVERLMGEEKIRSVIPAHLYYETADERFEIIMEKMKGIAKGRL